jgi:hypothetical protein
MISQKIRTILSLRLLFSVEDEMIIDIFHKMRTVKCTNLRCKLAVKLLVFFCFDPLILFAFSFELFLTDSTHVLFNCR